METIATIGTAAAEAAGTTANIAAVETQNTAAGKMSGEAQNAAIAFNKVSLRYPGSREAALHEVSFTVPHGAICGLLGRNGAGKTSIMALLAGFRKATSGSVRVFGHEVWENPLVAPEVSFIYQKNNPDDLMNAYKTHEYLRHAACFRPEWDDDYARYLLNRFDVPEKKRASKMSQGQRAALRCVLGLASNTPLTIFDEAYSGMDAVYRKIFVDELLASYLRHPRTILFSTHYIAEMEQAFSEVLIINSGRVLLKGDADSLRAGGQTIANLFISLTLKEGETYAA